MIKEIFTPSTLSRLRLLPLFCARVPAGFPSPAEDYQERELDLNEYLIHDAAATFMVRVTGDSMIDAGIHAGDLLIVDRGLSAQTGQIVIAIVDGDFTVKRLGNLHGIPVLIPENQAYAPICLQEGQELQIWGVVVGCVKKYVP